MVPGSSPGAQTMRETAFGAMLIARETKRGNDEAFGTIGDHARACVVLGELRCRRRDTRRGGGGSGYQRRGDGLGGTDREFIGDHLRRDGLGSGAEREDKCLPREGGGYKGAGPGTGRTGH